MAIRSLLPSIWRNERKDYNPAREVNHLQRRINDIFDEFFSSSALSRWAQPSMNLAELEQEFSPPCDIQETDREYLVSFDLPGVNKDEVKIEVQGNQLTVSGERKKEQKVESKGHLNTESFYGSFFRSFSLPNEVEADYAEANFENGVLKISLPKAEKSSSKQIPINQVKGMNQRREAKETKLEKTS